MSEVDSQPNLRLVRCDDWPVAAASSAARQAPVRLLAESRDANHKPPLEPTDPRWILAARAYSQLEDQTLTFQHRERLLRMGRQLGVRPSDVNMIIAIVQDHARRGIDLSEAVEVIALLKQPAAGASAGWIWARWAAAIATALVANALLIWWLTA